MTRPYNFAELVGIAKSEDWPTLFLWVQEPMLTFRVDFLLVGYNPVRDDCRRLVVECDGHDYHSAFEAQRRDADRDRQLRPHLWGIVHYAGSEIRRDPDRIAGELIAMMVAS
jgi:very-short-patch-repair endonuclease